MKLRIAYNSIRIRLGSIEVNLLQDQGVVKEELKFPGGEKLAYKLLVSDQFRVEMDGNKINISVPEKEAMRWMESAELSLSEVFVQENGDELRLLVEKDLKLQ